MNTIKKSALALAVAAAIGMTVTAQADTTLYGSARVSVDYDDVDLPGEEDEDIEDFFDEGAWDVVNNASRLGVRGSEDLGGGLSAIYQYEFGVDTTEGGSFNNNRPKWVGLKGGFGSVMAGTQWTPYYNALGIADIFNTDKYSFTIANRNFMGPHRTDNTLAYVTPNFGGFEFQAALMMNGLERGDLFTTGSSGGPANEKGDSPLPNTTEDVDAWNLAAIYKNGPLFAGVTYVALEGNDDATFVTANGQLITDEGFNLGDQQTWGVGLGYTFGPVGLSFIYEGGDIFGSFTPNIGIDENGNAVLVGAGSNEADHYYGNISYTLGNAVLRAAYGLMQVEPQTIAGVEGQDFDITHWLIGAQYNFSKRTRVWVEYLDQDGDDVVLDRQTVSMGMRHDF